MKDLTSVIGLNQCNERAHSRTKETKQNQNEQHSSQEFKTAPRHLDLFGEKQVHNVPGFKRCFKMGFVFRYILQQGSPTKLPTSVTQNAKVLGSGTREGRDPHAALGFTGACHSQQLPQEEHMRLTHPSLASVLDF